LAQHLHFILINRDGRDDENPTAEEPEMKTKLAYLMITSLTALMLSLSACGVVDEGPVKARNLASGEIKTFPSADDVPTNWAPCPDPQCSVPPYIPCDWLSEKVCSLHPGCRLKTLWCMGQTDPVPPNGGGTKSNTGSTPPAPMPEPPPPPDCKYTCIPKLPLTCEELSGEKQCLSRPDCEWGAMACPMSCAAPGPCPPCPSSCTTKTPPVCQGLTDKNSCAARSDCEWTQSQCPGAPCMPGGPCPPCPFTCNPKGPQACPPYAPPVPMCKDGTVVPKYDSKGCLVAYECKPYYTSCSKLNQAYMAAVKAAKACNPISMQPMIQCSAQVDTQLFCPICPTFVNPSNKAFATLVDLKKQWKAQSCHLQEIACPAVMCQPPTSASCLGTGTVGTCTNDPI
jgi:hypothetical protein